MNNNQASAPPRTAVLKLAQIVLKPGDVRLYSSDGANHLGDYASLTYAVSSSRPFCKEAADDIFFFDGDNGRQIAALFRTAEELRRHSIVPVIVNSGGFFEEDGKRLPRRHLFAHIPSLTLRAYITRFAQYEAGTKSVASARRVIRPPLSPHRSNNIPTLVEPATVEDAISALTPTISRFEPSMTGRMIDLLRQGDIAGKYAKRDHAIQAVVNSMVAANWTKAKIFGAVMHPQNRVGAKWQEIARTDQKDAGRRLERSFKAASDRVKASPTLSSRVEPMRVIEQFTQDLIRHRLNEFKGLRGKTAFAVLCGHIHTAHRLGRFKYALSERALREFSRVLKRDTIRRANSWLEDRGYIRRVGIKKSGWLSRFEIIPKPSEGNPDLAYQDGQEVVTTQNRRPCFPLKEQPTNGRRELDNIRPVFDPTLFALPEAFLSGRGSLGFGPMVVWIIADDLTRSEIAQRLGVDPHTAGVHLGRLEKVSLAECSGNIWRAIRSKIALEAAAKKLGVWGTRRILERLDERERQAFREALEPRLAAIVEGQHIDPAVVGAEQITSG